MNHQQKGKKGKKKEHKNIWNNKLLTHRFKQGKREMKNVSDGYNKYLLSANYGQNAALSILYVLSHLAITKYL